MITSVSNPAIKRIRALRQRKERETSGLYFVEGLRIVTEAVQVRAPVDTLVVAPDLLTSPFGNDLVAHAALPVMEVSADVFKSLSAKDGPQGIGALIRQRWTPLEQIRPTDALCWIALVAAQDPGNIGTILRTADAVGAGGLILLEHSADPYDPGAVRASMGALFSLSLTRANTAEFTGWARSHSITVVGSSDRAAQDYQTIQYHAPLALLMGSEREGLSPEHMAACDVTVRIPMVGRSDSLNLAVATAVLLYEVFNQRRAAQQ
jgi:TrmH family RNA methyltransferase